MTIVCRVANASSWKRGFEGVKKNRNSKIRSNHKQLKTFSKITREETCVPPRVCCVSLVMTFESCTHKLQQYFLVRTKNLLLTEFVCEAQQVEDFDLNCFLGTVFILTSQSQVHSSNVGLLLLPEMWGYFCVKTKANVSFTQQQMSEKYTLFFDDWMMFELLSVLFCWVKSFLGAEIPPHFVNFSFFCWQNQQSNYFPFSVFWLHLRSCISTPLILCFEKHFLFRLAFCFGCSKKTKKQRKTYSKRGWNCCSVQSFFLKTGNK